MNRTGLLNNITIAQYRQILHTIGFSRDKVKYRKYTVWRNYYTTSEHIEELDKLVDLGVMNKSDRLDTWQNCVIYFVTDLGLEFVSECENVKIIKEKANA